MGIIPSYEVIDISTSYMKGIFRFEIGVNNLLNENILQEEQQAILVQVYTITK